MAIIAALLTEHVDRAELRASAPDHQVVWTSTWRALERRVRESPVALAVAALRAEPRADGIRRAERFRRRFPRTPLIVWGEATDRERGRLQAVGVGDVVRPGDRAARQVVAERLRTLSRAGLPAILGLNLPASMRVDARSLVLEAAHAVGRSSRVTRVAEVAAARGISVSTLARRCADWALPTPGRLLLWLRVLQGLHWLLEPGRSVESVAGQLGYSSGAAFRRAIRATVGHRPTALRNERAFHDVLDTFLAECRTERSRAAAAS